MRSRLRLAMVACGLCASVAGLAAQPPATSPVPPAPASGWSTFQIKKTAAEMIETARLADDPTTAARTGPQDVKTPPQSDLLRLSTGIGYLQGADWGGDLSGSGRVNGMMTDVTGFFTAGPQGFEVRSGRLSMFTPSGRWRGEAGDLYSDLGGLARGGRVSWTAGQKWTPSLSLYVPHAQDATERRIVAAYRDRVQLGRRVRAGVELSSEGGSFLQGQYLVPRLDLTAYTRFTRGRYAGHDRGMSGGLNLGRRAAISGALRVSNAANDTSSRWQLASLRLPLAKQASVTLERSWWTGSADEGSTNALTLQLPLGPVRVMQRLQWGHTDYPQRALPFGFDRRQSQSAASYTPGAWGAFDYQQSTQWFEDGRSQQWDEVASMFQVGRNSLQVVSAFPDLLEPSRLRIRLQRRLSPTLQLEGQYGRLSAFQMSRASEQEQSRVMLTIRKTWQVRSPARGGEVRGRTIDQAGRPVSGALVQLGPYSAITDAGGDYSFTRVPAGEFALGLDRAKLPVTFAWDESPQPMTVTRGARLHGDLQVIPLGTIRGRVYRDRNANGRYDDGEGVPNVVLAMSVAVTASGANGTYAFYNQPPGHYTIRLDVPRLGKALAPVSPTALQVELTGDQPVVGADFTVEQRDMPIIMREVRR